MQMDDYITFLDSFDNLKFISYESSPTIQDIIKTIEKEAEGGCRLFYIDTIWNIIGWKDEIDRLSAVSSQLRIAVNNLWVCIMCLHHMKKPQATDWLKPWGWTRIRGTQKLIDDSTIVAEIWRDLDPDEEDPKSLAEVRLLQYKDTLGWHTGAVDFYYDNGTYSNTYAG